MKTQWQNSTLPTAVKSRLGAYLPFSYVPQFHTEGVLQVCQIVNPSLSLRLTEHAMCDHTAGHARLLQPVLSILLLQLYSN